MKLNDFNRTWLPLLKDAALVALAGLSLAACERMEPAPEATVVLQSSGSFTQGETRYPDATLLVHQEMGEVSVEIQRRETTYDCPAGVPTPPSNDDISKCKAVHTTLPVATANFKFSRLQDVLEEARGALHTVLKGATLRVEQPCSIEKELTGISGPGSGDSSVQGSFKFDGTRWIQYNSGLLERGVEGRVQVQFKSADGAETALFDGMVTRQRPGRDHLRVFSGGPIAVGTSAAGHVEGAATLGGTAFGSHGPDSTHGNMASIALALPYGAGKIEIQGEKKIFDFDPLTDVTYPNGLGVITVLSRTDSRVAAEDRFQGHIQVPHIDFGPNVWCSVALGGQHNPWCADETGSGTGDFNFSLSIDVDPSRLLVVATVSLSANLSTSEGKTLTYKNDLRPDGSSPHIDTMLDW